MKNAGKQKLKKTKSGLPDLELKENPDILKKLSGQKKRRARLIIGFAAETENVIEHALEKRARKNCDWIVANDVSATGNVFGNDETTVHIISEAGIETLTNITKQDAAHKLMTLAALQLGGKTELPKKPPLAKKSATAKKPVQSIKNAKTTKQARKTAT